MAIALLALLGLLISVYLLLYKIGFYGALACGSGGCETVQASRYAMLLGVPVAGWGVVWYAAVFGLAIVSVQPRFSNARWIGSTLLALAAAGLAFSGYLTYVELFVIGAICRWCLVSAALTVLIFLLAAPLHGRRDLPSAVSSSASSAG